MKHIFHINDKRIVGLSQDVLLSPRVQNLSFVYENVLVDSLHGVLLTVLFIDDKKHFSKRALVYQFFDFEVVQSNLTLGATMLDEN